MKKASYRWIPALTAAAMCLVGAACSVESETEEGAPDRAVVEYGTEGDIEPAESAAEDGTEGDAAPTEGGGEPEATESGGEHAGSERGGEHGGGEHDEGGAREGEESSVYVGAAETWDAVRNGARLVLKFYPERGVFFGTVENTTDGTLCAVRVEVHLDSGTELGPTERMDVEPGQTVEVALSSDDEAFESWTAHPERSPCGD